MKPEIGKIKKIKNIREVWPDEAKDFTPWLAKEENLLNLGNDIGISLSNIKVNTEVDVGSFSCDIVCEDDEGNKLVIENQYGRSDHDHLGKTITYASGQDAKTIIWIVEDAKDEHVRAFKWLNENASDIKFILLEIGIIQIDNSKYAPQFKIIVEPDASIKNSFNKGVSEPGNVQIKRLEFWTKFNNVLESRNSFNARKPTMHHWYGFATGSTHWSLSLDLVNKENKIRVNVIIKNQYISAFDSLLSKKDDIEKKIGLKLIWRKMEDANYSLISYEIHEFDFENNSNWEILMNKSVDTLEKFKEVFSKENI